MYLVVFGVRMIGERDLHATKLFKATLPNIEKLYHQTATDLLYFECHLFVILFSLFLFMNNTSEVHFLKLVIK